MNGVCSQTRPTYTDSEILLRYIRTTNPYCLFFQVTKSLRQLRIERMGVRLQGFDYKLNYVPGKKAEAETNKADYNSRHPQPLETKTLGQHTRQNSLFVKMKNCLRRTSGQGCKRHFQMQYHGMSCKSGPGTQKLKSAIARGTSWPQNNKPLGRNLTQSLQSWQW